MITEELINLLMDSGLTKQQANSLTAEACIKALMPEDGKELIAEARRVVNSMNHDLFALRKEYTGLADTILQIEKAQQDYGAITDDRAKNALSLYVSLMSINEKMKVRPEQSAETVGYIVYAYLGGKNANFEADDDSQKHARTI